MWIDEFVGGYFLNRHIGNEITQVKGLFSRMIRMSELQRDRPSESRDSYNSDARDGSNEARVPTGIFDFYEVFLSNLFLTTISLLFTWFLSCGYCFAFSVRVLDSPFFFLCMFSAFPCRLVCIRFRSPRVGIAMN